MPGKRDFLAGFGLAVRKLNTLLVTNKVTSIDIAHVEVNRFKLYQYPIRITFRRPLTEAEVAAVRDQCAGHRVIASQYGNPYRCTVSNFIFYDNTLEATGFAHRV
jgi:hypothetical protein